MQKGIELLQIRRFHGDLRRGRKFRTLLRQRDHRLRRQRVISGQQHPQGVVDRRFAVAGRAVQDRQVFFGLPAFVEPFPEAVVGQAEARGREEVVAVRVVRERPRLADQRIDDVAVVHRVLVPAHQARQRVGELIREPDFDPVGVEPGLHPLADQPAVHRIDAAVEVDQAPGIDAAPHLPETGLTLLGQFLQGRDLLGEAIPPTPVADGDQIPEKSDAFLPIGEVPAATQQQRLVDGGLEVAVRRFGVAVLVRLPGIDPLPRQAVVIQEVAVAGAEFPRRRQVVHRRAEAVAAVLPGHAPEFPQSVLQPFRKCFERFRRAHRHRFPIRVGQHEVVDEVVERPPRHGHAERIHAGEVGRGQIAGSADLPEDRELPRTVGGPPLPHPAFERAPVRIEELAGVLAAEPVEERLGRELRLGPQLRFDLCPDRRKRVDAGAVGPRRLLPASFARQRRVVPVMAGRLLGHPCPPGRLGQRSTSVEKLPQFADLAIRDHRRPPRSRESPMASNFPNGNSNCRRKGVLIAGLQQATAKKDSQEDMGETGLSNLTSLPSRLSIVAQPRPEKTIKPWL